MKSINLQRLIYSQHIDDFFYSESSSYEDEYISDDYYSIFGSEYIADEFTYRNYNYQHAKAEKIRMDMQKEVFAFVKEYKNK